MARENDMLPGSPSKRLVREVKRGLYHWGISPTRGCNVSIGKVWLKTWTWAAADASRTSCLHIMAGLKTTKRARWPSACEIVRKYLFIFLLEIREQSPWLLRIPTWEAKNPAEMIERIKELGYSPDSVPALAQAQAEPLFLEQ